MTSILYGEPFVLCQKGMKAIIIWTAGIMYPNRKFGILTRPEDVISSRLLVGGEGVRMEEM
jgi:hypothetical protein